MIEASLVAITFESVDEIQQCDHSNESYLAVLSCGTVYNTVQGGCNFWVCGWNPAVWPFKWNLFASIFTWHFLFLTIKILLHFLLCSLLGVKGAMATRENRYQLSFLERYLLCSVLLMSNQNTYGACRPLIPVNNEGSRWWTLIKAADKGAFRSVRLC